MTNLIGLAELAELYGVSKNTANTWARRHDFPRPVITLKMGPVWQKSDVLAWKSLPPDLGRRGLVVFPRCFFCGGKLVSLSEDGYGKCESGDCLETKLTVSLEDGQVQFSTSPLF